MSATAEYRQRPARRGVRWGSARRRADRRWRRALLVGLLAAAAVHVAVVLLFRTARPTPTAASTAAGPAAGDYRAARGGGGLTMLDVRPRTAPPPKPVPVPVPAPVPEVEVKPEPPKPRLQAPGPVEPSLPGTAAGAGSGDAAGPGTPTGTGRGGGGADEGGASGILAPRPRGIFIPPAGQPASARGQDITIWVFVAPSGRVVPDSTRLEPPTSDGRYNRRLIQTANDWVFDPARRAGRAVGAWFSFGVTL